MNKVRCALILLLMVSLLLGGCAVRVTAEETVMPTVAPTQVSVEETAAPTEAPTEPAEPARFTLKETVFPEKDAATGTLTFYINN